METLVQSCLRNKVWLTIAWKELFYVQFFKGIRTIHSWSRTRKEGNGGPKIYHMFEYFFLFVINRSIVYFVDGGDRESQNWPLFAVVRNAWPLRWSNLKVYHLPLMSNLYSIEKDISAMFFLINHIIFGLLTLRSSLFH